MISVRLIVLLGLLGLITAKRAIVTLLSGPPANAEKYVRLLHFFVYSLRHAGYNGEIAVMHTKDYPINHEKLSGMLNVVLIPVEKIVIPHNNRNAQYATMLTKLHIFGLTQYEQLMYFDCDFVFQHNPESAFDKCSWSNLCATPDTGISNFDKSIPRGTYFNGGFLVIRPDQKTYESLLRKKQEAYGRPFVEQDLLNDVYKNKWGKLDVKYNLMHCYQLSRIESNIIAIHEKMWILKQSFPQDRYIWNSAKMQINYPITDLLTSAKPHLKASSGATEQRKQQQRAEAFQRANSKRSPSAPSLSGMKTQSQDPAAIMNTTTPSTAVQAGQTDLHQEISPEQYARAKQRFMDRKKRDIAEVWRHRQHKQINQKQQTKITSRSAGWAETNHAGQGAAGMDATEASSRDAVDNLNVQGATVPSSAIDSNTDSNKHSAGGKAHYGEAPRSGAISSSTKQGKKATKRWAGVAHLQ